MLLLVVGEHRIPDGPYDGRMRTILALLLLLFLAPWGTVHADDLNLLPNGGFEEGLDGWLALKNSGRATMEPDRKVRKRAGSALHIAKTGGAPFDLVRREHRGRHAGHPPRRLRLGQGQGRGQRVLQVLGLRRGG